MDPFVKIKEEHQNILGTLAKLVRSDPLVRRERMDDLVVQIYMHMNAEERTIYCEFKKLNPDFRSLVIQNEQEHYVGKFLMNELMSRGLNEETWEAKLNVLRFLLEHHADMEETKMFDVASDYFKPAEIEAMTKRMEEVEVGLFRESRLETLRRA